jgi:anti-sigma factor RsiW
MKDELKLKLQAMLDGELSAAEAEQVRRLAAADPEAGPLLAELQSIKSVLVHHEPAAALAETRAFYWSKIVKQIERAEHPRQPAVPWFARWRLLWPALAGATALAAVLVVSVRHSSPPAEADHVSVTADGFEARAFRDQSSGMSFVFLHETRKPQPVRQPPPPAHSRNDGSSFMVEFE